MAELDVAGYLSRLGWDGAVPPGSGRAALPGSGDLTRPSVAALFALHRAHVERVPYETLEFQLGRPTTVDPHESAARVIANRGGYCFMLNGAFSALLTALGYEVRWHVGGVQGMDAAGPVGANGNHLALSVHGLPDPRSPDGNWLVDVGLGDALYEPLPLRPGRYRQGPFEYRVRRSEVERAGWRLDHDPRGCFVGMDFAEAPAGTGDFEEMHRRLSTSPDSGFVRIASVQRRHALGADLLRGCVLRSVTGSGCDERTVATQRRWFGTLAEVFGLTLDDVTRAERDALWERVHNGHRRYMEAR